MHEDFSIVNERPNQLPHLLCWTLHRASPLLSFPQSQQYALGAPKFWQHWTKAPKSIELLPLAEHYRQAISLTSNSYAYKKKRDRKTYVMIRSRIVRQRPDPRIIAINGIWGEIATAAYRTDVSQDFIIYHRGCEREMWYGGNLRLGSQRCMSKIFWSRHHRDSASRWNCGSIVRAWVASYHCSPVPLDAWHLQFWPAETMLVVAS